MQIRLANQMSVYISQCKQISRHFHRRVFLLAADFLLLLLWPFITLGLKLFGDFSDESSHFTMNRLIVIITVYSNLLRFVSVFFVSLSSFKNSG